MAVAFGLHALAMCIAMALALPHQVMTFGCLPSLKIGNSFNRFAGISNPMLGSAHGVRRGAGFAAGITMQGRFRGGRGGGRGGMGAGGEKKSGRMGKMVMQELMTILR